MRYIRYAILAAIGVCLITVALANRDAVTLNLLPQGLADLLGYPAAANTLTLPMFLVILGSIVAGVAIGFVWEWLREHKHRAEARHERRERERLEAEVDRLTDTGSDTGDDVLAMLEAPAAAR